MASSNVARFLMKQYLDSLENEDKSHSSSSSSDTRLDKFKALSEKSKANIFSAALAKPESNSSLDDLDNALDDWRILKDQKKAFKRGFSCLDVAHINVLSPINVPGNIEKLLTESSQPILQLWDRYTFYKPAIEKEKVSIKLEEKYMVDWLLTSGEGLKAVGIYGLGGSGKTVLVKNVLSQKAVGEKFKRIIWACLSQLTCEEEIDVRIMEYVLYRLGLDTDSLLVGDLGEDKDSLMEEVKRRLMNSSGNYILVLDDMWHCSEWFADKFLGMLKKNSGSAVIVTSRRKTVAEQIGDKNKVIHLKYSPAI